MRSVDSLAPLSVSPRRPASAPPPAEKATAQGLAGDQLALQARVPAAASAPGAFAYAGMTVPDHRVAQGWRPGAKGPSGIEANRAITAGYHDLDQAMTGYLGEPAIANWLTFGKYASRQAGVQIADLEDLIGASKLRPGAMVDLLKNADAGKFGTLLPFLKQNYKDYLTGMHSTGIMKKLLQIPVLGPLVASPLGFPIFALRRVQELRDALVKGNTAVWSDVAPAFDTFMKAEAQGKDGVAALKAAGYDRLPAGKDYIVPAFEKYRQARALTEKAAAPEIAPSARESLLARRKTLVNEANLLLVTHEQMDVVQDPTIFGDPDVASMIGAMKGRMTVDDALGAHPLLPKGGNWTDFETRMGYVPVAPDAPGAIRVKDREGKVHHYAPAPSPAARPGTIASYFESGLDPATATKLIKSAPPRVA